MRNRQPAIIHLALVFLALSPLSFAADPHDYSKEAFVIQNTETKVSFAANGARDWRQSLSIRLQSEAAVRQFGVLGFTYDADDEQMTVEYVRVKKADGSVVETPASSIQDVASQVAVIAPTYTGVRQKQVPVKALGVGDTLEYSVHSVQSEPEIPGQFWYSQNFIMEGIVLNELIEIRVPKDRYVQVSSPKVKPETHSEAAQMVYTWRHSRMEPTPPDSKKASATEDDLPKIELTSFRNWEEVGNWWRSVAAAQTTVTPALTQKAKELTGGLTSDAAKEKAIYNYVSLKFRYISISLGAGKYRPHAAAEVLSNQYGDCKDKHTLFAALLNAAGIQAFPALIGAGIKFDATFPSPGQFNHVITVIPQDGKYIWLDTTAETAPFGLLTQSIRDQQALVIPSAGKPVLMKTPMDPPFTSDMNIEVKGALANDGTLTGHFDLQLTGEGALAARAGFRQLAPTQWQALAQQISYSLNYAGDVSAVAVDNLEDLDKPFHLAYDYTRKDFSDWKEHKIAMPLPPIGFGPGDEADKPKDAFWTGAPGVLSYRSSIEMPKGFSVEMPSDRTASSPFAEYSAQYSFKNGMLVAERRMTVKKSKVNPEQWTEYQTFNKDVRTDQAQMASLSETSPERENLIKRPGAEREEDQTTDRNTGIEDLMRRAGLSLQARQTAQAADLLKQVERMNPRQPGLWATRSYLELMAGHTEQGIADAQKEVRLHPDEVYAYAQLAGALIQAGRREQAIQALRDALSMHPENAQIALEAARLLIAEKQYADISALLEKPIASAPDRFDLQVVRDEAFLKSGNTTRGLAEAQRIAKATSDSDTLNDLAFYLSEANVGLETAHDLAQKAIEQLEKVCAQVTLGSLEAKDLSAVNSLAAAWDTLGWIEFKEKNLPAAEKSIGASWRLSQRSDVAGHLALVYDTTGRHAEAVRMWQLAVAADTKNEDARNQLRKAGLPDSGPLQIHEKGSKFPIFAAQELGTLRSLKLPTLAKQTASSEVFLLLSAKGIEDIRFIEGGAVLKDAPAAIRSTTYDFSFPDSGPEKIVRRAILFCSEHTDPSCNLTLLTPSATKLAPMLNSASGDSVAIGDPSSQPPTLLAKVEPEYTKAALDAKIEGTVTLSVIIDETGAPHHAVIVRSLGFGLDEKATECVLKWRFNPATRNGKAVETEARIEVNFRILK